MADYKELYPAGGALKSPEDERDYKIDQLVCKAVPLPAEYIVKTPAIIANQQRVSSCVACSLAQIKHCQEYQEMGDNKMFSGAYIYGNRQAGDYEGAGMYPREALKNLVKNGACHEEDFPGYDTYEYDQCKELYNVNKETLDRKAKPYRISSYYNLPSLRDIKTALYTANQYVQICYDVHECLYTPDINGKIPYNRLNPGRSYGGHSMVCCGYSDTKQALLVINSWGKDYGINVPGVADGGLIWIPYDYPFMEAWAAIDAKTEKELIENYQ